MWTKILVATLLVSALSACKIEEGHEDSGALTYRSGDDFLKVAVNHIGANCEDEVGADPSHYLDGPNGELILEEAKINLGRTQWRGFSGDKVMGRTSDESVTKMEDIKDKCRRLILSVDVEDGMYPSIQMEKGSTLQNKKAKFEADFGKNGYGDVDCLSDTKLSLCTFAKIKGKSGKKRWFTYLEPDNASRSIKGTVNIIQDSGSTNDTEVVDSYPITLKGIYRANPTLSAELKNYLDRKCIANIGHIGQEFEPSTDAPHKVYERTYPGRYYSYRKYTGSGTCKNKIYGLEDPQVVQYLETCKALCISINKATPSGTFRRFALQFAHHNLIMDCKDDAIGFHVENDKLYWKENEGSRTATSWYECRNGGSYAVDIGEDNNKSGNRSSGDSSDKVERRDEPS